MYLELKDLEESLISTDKGKVSGLLNGKLHLVHYCVEKDPVT